MFAPANCQTLVIHKHQQQQNGNAAVCKCVCFCAWLFEENPTDKRQKPNELFICT